MTGFACKNCNEDLTVRIDLLAMTLRDEYPDGDYPEDLSVEGNCSACESGFAFSGHMFTQFMKAKVEEGVISDEAEEYEIINIPLTEEQLEEFNILVEDGDQKGIEEFIHEIIKKML